MSVRKPLYVSNRNLINPHSRIPDLLIKVSMMHGVFNLGSTKGEFRVVEHIEVSFSQL